MFGRPSGVRRGVGQLFFRRSRPGLRTVSIAAFSGRRCEPRGPMFRVAKTIPDISPQSTLTCGACPVVKRRSDRFENKPRHVDRLPARGADGATTGRPADDAPVALPGREPLSAMTVMCAPSGRDPVPPPSMLCRCRAQAVQLASPGSRAFRKSRLMNSFSSFPSR